MAGKKWTPEQKKKFLATMAKKNKKGGAALDHTHQGILYLKAAERLIRDKPLNQLTEAEVYGHLAFKALTER